MADTVVRGVLRSNASALGRLCRPPTCEVENLDPGFDVFITLKPWRDAKGALHTEPWKGIVYLADETAVERLQRGFPTPSTVVEVRLADPRPTPGGTPSHHRFAIRPVADADLERSARQ